MKKYYLPGSVGGGAVINGSRDWRAWLDTTSTGQPIFCVAGAVEVSSLDTQAELVLRSEAHSGSELIFLDVVTSSDGGPAAQAMAWREVFFSCSGHRVRSALVRSGAHELARVNAGTDATTVVAPSNVEAQIDFGVPGLVDYREIGFGGFSTVYSAFEVDTSRHVALKVLRMVDERGRRRFERERRTMGQTTGHGNIVTMFRSGYTDLGNRPYLVLEYMSGGSLQDRLDSQGPLPVKDAVELIVPVARGLEFAHSMGIVHKDIKPANILISATGTPKLGDFGIAALRDATGTSQVAFSLAYTAPETFDSTKGPGGEVTDTRDERSDLYSLAATLYTLINGTAPFNSSNQAGLIHQILFEPPQASVHPVLDSFFSVALAKKPDDRYPNAPQFIHALTEAVVERRLEATPATSSAVEHATRVISPLSPVHPADSSGPAAEEDKISRSDPSEISTPPTVGGEPLPAPPDSPIQVAYSNSEGTTIAGSDSRRGALARDPDSIADVLSASVVSGPAMHALDDQASGEQLSVAELASSVGSSEPSTGPGGSGDRTDVSGNRSTVDPPRSHRHIRLWLLFVGLALVAAGAVALPWVFYSAPDSPEVEASVDGGVITWNWNEPDGNRRDIIGYDVSLDGADPEFQTERRFVTSKYGPLERHTIEVSAINSGGDESRNTSSPGYDSAISGGEATITLSYDIDAGGDDGIAFVSPTSGSEVITSSGRLNGAGRCLVDSALGSFISLTTEAYVDLVDGGLEITLTSELRYDPTGEHQPPEDSDCENYGELEPVSSQESMIVVPVANGVHAVPDIKLAGGGAQGTATNVTISLEVVADP